MHCAAHTTVPDHSMHCVYRWLCMVARNPALRGETL
jgi:hypothetical protein